jgi:hypothetical protein
MRGIDLDGMEWKMHDNPLDCDTMKAFSLQCGERKLWAIHYAHAGTNIPTAAGTEK